MTYLTIQETGYQWVRSAMSWGNRLFNQDYEPVVHAGQWLLTTGGIPSRYTHYSRYLNQLNIATELFSLRFSSPVTFAAFESHLDSLQFWLNLGCGGGCLKTIKPTVSKGNARPRLQQLHINGEEHLINALGLPGKGVHGLIQDLQASSFIESPHPMGISIGGHCLADYCQVVDALYASCQTLFSTQYLELNISCPNTTTGQSLHDNLSDLDALIRHIRSITTDVVVIKVSPNASDTNLCDIASLAIQHDSVTINAGNTQFRSVQSVGLPDSAISIGGGGLSGPLLFDRTLAMAKLLAPFKLPLMATGGIGTVDHVLALKPHGVVVVGMATQLVKNPFSVVRLNHDLHHELV
jgi:dihydroorotate dehydrogenase